MTFLPYMPSLTRYRIEPWIDSRGRWACYVWGIAVTKNGKIRRFKSRDAAVAAGEKHLAALVESIAS